VLNLDPVQPVNNAIIRDTGHANAGIPGARVNLHRDTVNYRIFRPPVDQTDSERMKPVNAGTPLRQQLTGPGRMRRHERLLILAEHKDPRVPRFRKFLIQLKYSGITPEECGGFRLSSSPVTIIWLANALMMLPSTMSHSGYRMHDLRAPFRPCPGVVCWHGFQSRALRKHALVGLLA